MAVLTGQEGLKASQLGLIELGGPVAPAPLPATLSNTALPFIARVYTNQYVFKGTLGPLLNTPTLKATINSGYHPITIETAVAPIDNFYGQVTYGIPLYGGSGASPGDLVTLTEQGGSGAIVFTGLVEDVPDLIQSGGASSHQISLTPLVVELGDAVVNQNYFTPTDIAVIVRDAVRRTAHLYYTPESIPNTGIMGVLPFSFATALDVLNTCRLVGGVNFFWFVDATGCVWFQPTGSGARYSARRGVDVSDRKRAGSISKLKNYVLVVGGVAPGASAPTVAIYSNAQSQQRFGLRAMNPPIVMPTITDQATVNAIAATAGSIFDRTGSAFDATLPNFGQRIVIGQPGGPTMRMWEPAADSLQETSPGNGIYSQNFIVLDVEQTGPEQKVILGDIPVAGIQDLKYEIDRIVQRMAALPISYTPASLNSPGSFGPSGSFSTGPAGGARAVYDNQGLHLYDSTNVQRIFLDANNAIEKVTDSAGVTRAELGNLQANGVSPAQYGFRANDATGSPIFDSLGLIGVMKLLASAGTNWTAGRTIAGVGGTAGISGLGGEVVIATTTFILTRTQSVLLTALVTGAAFATGSAHLAPVYIRVTGQVNSAAGAVNSYETGDVAGLAYSSASPIQVLTGLPAATYTVNLYWNSAAGVADTLRYPVNLLYVFLLGG